VITDKCAVELICFHDELNLLLLLDYLLAEFKHLLLVFRGI